VLFGKLTYTAAYLQLVDTVSLKHAHHSSPDRYPNHEASERIDKEHKEDIEKLRGDDGDFYHGFNTGVLAAARMFNDKADILHINDFEVSVFSCRQQLVVRTDDLITRFLAHTIRS
jgi:hypothetical protein